LQLMFFQINNYAPRIRTAVSEWWEAQTNFF
jgi:hypothetical protein